MAKVTAAALRYSELWTTASELKPRNQEGELSFLEVAGLKEVFPNGLRRGTIAEISGARSSGRTSLCLHILALATSQAEICAVVDLHDSFHPASAAAAGVQLGRIVWVRCGGNVEHAIRASDLLLHAGGFGVVALDLCEANARALNRIPISYWHRFRRAVEHTPTLMLLSTDSPQARSCSANSLQTKRKEFSWSGSQTTPLLRGLEIYATAAKVAVIRPLSLFLKTVA